MQFLLKVFLISARWHQHYSLLKRDQLLRWHHWKRSEHFETTHITENCPNCWEASTWSQKRKTLWQVVSSIPEDLQGPLMAQSPQRKKYDSIFFVTGKNLVHCTESVFAVGGWLQKPAGCDCFDHKTFGQVTCLQPLQVWHGVIAITLRQAGVGVKIISNL